MSLAGIAKSNEEILDRGSYQTASGQIVDVAEAVVASVRATTLYRPPDLQALLARAPRTEHRPMRLEVVEGKTGETARWLAAEVGQVPLALNFASARNPGGGYVRGAKAQEEDLARCSALVRTLSREREYYDANRATRSLLYTDHIIHSPSVPFFRDEKYELLDDPVLISVVTAPAPNAGECLRADAGSGPDIERTLRRRAGMVLAVAEDQGARHLVLGAWGCGVFRNDPVMVADAFGAWLESERFRGSFERVVFGIYGRRHEAATLRAFRARFGV